MGDKMFTGTDKNLYKLWRKYTNKTGLAVEAFRLVSIGNTVAVFESMHEYYLTVKVKDC